MGLASCASKVLPFSKATTMMRKPPGGLLLKMASSARAISCNLIPPPESTATLNVRGGREEKHTVDTGQWTMDNRQWTVSDLARSETRISVMGMGRMSRTYCEPSEDAMSKPDNIIANDHDVGVFRLVHGYRRVRYSFDDCFKDVGLTGP